MGNQVAVVRYSDGDEQRVSVVDSERFEAIRIDIEDELFSTIQETGVTSSESERPWSNDFAFGFIFGAQFALQGKLLSGNAKYLLRRALSDCNERYGNSAVLARITSRLIRSYSGRGDVDG